MDRQELKQIQKLVEMNGPVRAAELEVAFGGVVRYHLQILVQEGRIQRLRRGIYGKKESNQKPAQEGNATHTG